jgi:uncharacterized membrane protein
MRRVHFLIVLALVALSLVGAGSVAAKPGKPNDPKRPQARVTWSVPRVEQTLNPGQTLRVPVTLTSSGDLANVTLAIPGGLGRLLTIEPAQLGSLQAGEATSITLVFSVPGEGAHCQGGVIKVRAGNKTIPTPLNVKVTIAGDTGCDV